MEKGTYLQKKHRLAIQKTGGGKEKNERGES